MPEPPGLRIGSLCTGYGGLDMAVQQVLGGELVWVADNDPGAARILAHHHPQVPNLGDITTADWTAVQPVDIVCGGYPCQPFSSAGKRKGTADARHIWPHIATALRVLRPRYAVFENVAGHLSLGFADVLADLAALGFDAEWCTLRADQVGAAHRRNRLFLLASSRHAPAGPRSRGPRAAADAGRGRFQGGQAGDRTEPALRLADVDGPDIQWSAAADPAGDGRQQGRPEPAREQRGPDVALGGAPDWGRYAGAITRWQKAIGRPAPGPVDALGRLNPPFVEWLMGLPTGHVTDVPGLSRTAQLKALGNGVVPQQAAAALHGLMTRRQLNTAGSTHHRAEVVAELRWRSYSTHAASGGRAAPARPAAPTTVTSFPGRSVASWPCLSGDTPAAPGQIAAVDV